MAVEIELPEDIEHHLAKQWGPGTLSSLSQSMDTARAF